MFTKLLYKGIKFKKRKIRYGKKEFSVYIADSIGKKTLGLMHRQKLEKNEGMLFLFGRDGKYDIWMPNMKFSIDIIWLDSDERVLKIVENAQPCESIFACPAYISPSNARYVLEFNAGTAKKEGITRGSSFTLYPVEGIQETPLSWAGP